SRARAAARSAFRRSSPAASVLLANRQALAKNSSSGGLGITQVVALADLDAVVAQDVVGGRDMKIKIRHCMAEQELHAFVAGFLVAALDHDFLVLGAVDLPRRHGLDKGD